jgi:ABC-type amino acid transport substrate-binding protein
MFARVLTSLLLVVLGAPWSSPSQAQSTIVLCRLLNVPDQEVGGDILRAVYAQLGITVEFHDVEAARALSLSSTGQCDGEVQRIAKVAVDYPSLIRIEPPINFIEPAVFTSGRVIDVQGWESIRNHTVGIVQGVGSSEAGTRGMPQVHQATSLRNLILMLDRGRFEVMVTDQFSGEVEIRKLGLQDKIRPLKPPLERIYIYHYLHEKHRELAGAVAAVIRQMDASSELAQLRQLIVDRALLVAAGEAPAGAR